MIFLLDHILAFTFVALVLLVGLIVALLAPSREFRFADGFDDVLACQRCGCTDYRACPGGCAWASYDPPICTRCV